MKLKHLFVSALASVAFVSGSIAIADGKLRSGSREKDTPRSSILEVSRRPFYLIEDETVKRLSKDPTLARLKGIDQSGPAYHYSKTIPPYSRYTHSVGVYNLLKKHGASKAEMIAGLYHDTCHTVFSHTSDYLGNDYQEYVQESMHDSVASSILDNEYTRKYLQQEGLTPEAIDMSKNNFKMLDSKLPELCADRIEYTLHTAYLLGLLSMKQVQAIYDDLHYNHEQGFWYFEHDYYAFQFGYCSLVLNMKFWAAPWCFQQNMHLAKALKIALKLHIVTTKELFTLQDEEVINRLKQCKNPEIVALINHARIYTLDEKQAPNDYPYDIIYFKPKFRGVNPRVGKEGKLYTEHGRMRTVFSTLFNLVRNYCERGYYVAVAKSSVDSQKI